MRDRSSFIKDCVIAIISDDYENFQIIFDQTRRIGALRKMDVAETEVAEALRKAITEGYAAAYVLSPQPPHATEVEYVPAQLKELWFFVTPRGKSAAKGIPQLSSSESEATWAFEGKNKGRRREK